MIEIPEHPPCEHPHCGKTVPKRPKETIAQWLYKKYCSSKCHNTAAAATYKHPLCINCLEPVVRHNGEVAARWRARACCSRACADEKRRNSAQDARLRGDWDKFSPIDPDAPQPSFHEHNIYFRPDKRWVDRPPALPVWKSQMSWIRTEV